MYRLVVILIILTSLAACIDRVELPIRTEEVRLVVEGQITNEAPPYTVRLTYTGNYSEGAIADQFVQGAQVSLGNDQGRSTKFVSIGPGLYQTTDLTFRGEVGRAYSLTVALSDGKRYVSKPEQMPSVPVIDSVLTTFRRSDNFATPYRYLYSVSTRDPAAEKNYYRWTAYGITTRKSTGAPCSLNSPSSICFDRCWITIVNNDVNIYSDEAVNGNRIRSQDILSLPVYAVGPQLMEVLQYGITQSNYQFWKLYQQQNARTGSIFDPLPAPVVGNLINVNDPTDVARGYFATVSITRKRFRNQAPESTGTAVYGFISSQLLPQGDCRNTYGPVPVVEPDGWL
ncbi:DUF4249 domain-containing protein [Spirosoma oryzicola]|uniref:DUF4249 domain-containing protein n=1 Tax=Spirosoma oryzicola TaxID=2898794 RepID=UPI001E47AA03|nr:DUF4249 domain-containing protein [Spirosoma oryzicola]UHG92636.1 DUF4249 domain-containing protein [Spirosoma oryzicola]